MTVRISELAMLVAAVQLTCFIVSTAVVFRDGPEDVVAVVGKTAVLRCTVQPQGAEQEYVKWVLLATNEVLSKDEAVVASAHEDRYSVVGNHEAEGEYWLKITGVQYSDAGEYRCTYGSVYRSVTLTVVSPPDPGMPICDVNPEPALQRPGGISELSCRLSGSSPPAELVWYRDGSAISEVAQQTNDMQRVVAADDNGVKFACVTKLSAATMAEPRSCEVTVLHKPPTGLIDPERHILLPGDAATYTCTGDGTPEVSSYSWMVNYIYVTNEKGRGMNRYELLNNNRTLRISNVRRREDGAVIICEVSIASGLTGRAWAKLSIAPLPVTSAANDFIPGLLSPPIEEIPIEQDKRNIVPTILKPQTNDGKAGVVAGTVLSTVGVMLALVVMAVLFIRLKMNRQFSMMDAHKSKCFQDASVLQTGTIKKVDECPIYAKPNKARKGQAPAPPCSVNPAAAPAGELAAQRKKSRKDHHSYEKVDILGLSSPGQTRTLPVRLQGQAPPASPGNRHSDTVGIVKAQAPLPPGLPPPRRSPPPRPTQSSPPSSPGLSVLYAELELSARSPTSNNHSQPAVGVDYAHIQVHKPPC